MNDQPSEAVNRIRFILLLGLFALLTMPVQAQTRKMGGEWAWKPLFKHEGVDFKYIFYQEADSKNNGVVIMLINTNDYAVEYRFKVIFRAGGDEVVRETSGELDAGQAKTGDADGLFWIPSPDGRTISEVGLRGYTITPKEKVGT